MNKRIVEVEWEDSAVTHGWTHDEPAIDAVSAFTAGYIIGDDPEGVSLVFNTAVGQHCCSVFIPRSAIRKVTELSRKRG